MIPAIIVDECWLRSLFGVAADGGGIQSALGQHRKLVLAKNINCPRHISTCIRRQIDWCGFI
jgi:hypothetical protein